MLLRVRSGEQRDVFEQTAEVDFHKVQLAGTHKVDQRLHDSIEPLDLASNDVHVAASVGVELRQLVLQQLQMEHDRINGILDFMGYAARNSSTGRKSPGHLDLVSNPADRFGIAHDQQCADLRPSLLNKIHGHLKPSA